MSTLFDYIILSHTGAFARIYINCATKTIDKTN